MKPIELSGWDKMSAQEIFILLNFIQMFLVLLLTFSAIETLQKWSVLMCTFCFTLFFWLVHTSSLDLPQQVRKFIQECSNYRTSLKNLLNSLQKNLRVLLLPTLNGSIIRNRYINCSNLDFTSFKYFLKKILISHFFL